MLSTVPNGYRPSESAVCSNHSIPCFYASTISMNYMKTSLSIAIVGILILSGFGAAKFINVDYGQIQKVVDISFSNKLTIQEKDGYLIPMMEGTNTLLMDACKPNLPIYREVFTFPSGVKIKDVSCTFSKIIEESIMEK